VGLTGDHVRLIVERGLTKKQLLAGIQAEGLLIQACERGEPTLEDVFLSLAKG
jgi:hypothetical protein